MSRERLKAIRDEARDAIGEDAAETTVALNPMAGIRSKDMLRAIRRTALQITKQPAVFAKHSLSMWSEWIEIIGGNSGLAAHPKDRRFTDPAWQGNPLYRVWLQGYLSWKNALGEWLADTDLEGMDLRRAQFAVDLITDTMAPTNSLIGNPAAIKRTIDTGGRSLGTGFIQMLQDLRNNNGMPAQVDTSKYDVGENLAVTEGRVVFRNELLELMQYQPTTESVYSIPLLVVPPQINKYYCLDLSPEKSLFKFLVEQGFQVFAVSWKNPGPEMRDKGLDHYIEALKEAITAVQSISRSPKINIMGACSGGITSSVLAGHLQALGDSPINAISLFVCVLSQRADDSDLGIFTNARTLEYARKQSQDKGVLEGSSLARTFNWMRPNDLIWNYVVNNYLMGNKPPAFDVLYWNNDSTNLTATLHSDFIDILHADPFVTAGDLSVCDTAIDLSHVKSDVFLMGGVTDHITPWPACYRSTKIFGGKVE
ncbi:MAG: alpha/beta fold hydrolase, partial [Pseudomonadales bacterium]